MIEETTSLAMIFSNKLGYEKGWEAKEKNWGAEWNKSNMWKAFMNTKCVHLNI